MWEDPANKAGGRWLLTLDRYQRNQWLDQIWVEIGGNQASSILDFIIIDCPRLGFKAIGFDS